MGCHSTCVGPNKIYELCRYLSHRWLIANLLEVVSHLAHLLRVHGRGHILIVGAHNKCLASFEDGNATLALLANHHLLIVAQVHVFLARNHDSACAETRGVVKPSNCIRTRK